VAGRTAVVDPGTPRRPQGTGRVHVVSARTVEGHIYRACIKLDVSDREQLAAVIRHGKRT